MNRAGFHPCRPAARRCVLRIHAAAPTQTGPARDGPVTNGSAALQNGAATTQPVLYHEFDAAQLERVNTLAVSMKQCGAATAAVSIVSAAVMAIQVDGAEGTVLAAIAMPLPAADMLTNPPLAVPATPDDLPAALSTNIATFFKTYSVAGITRPVDGLLLSALVVYAAAPFSRVPSTPSPRQLRSVLQGIQRLSLVFEQMFVASIAVVTITLLDAATVWPDVVVVASAVFFVVAIMRSAALGYLLSARRTAMDDVDGQLAAYAGVGASPISQLSQTESPLLQRLAVGLTLGHMLQYEANADHHTFLWSLTRYWARAPPDEPIECSLPQYEMSNEEKQLLRVCMNSAEVAALALAAQGGASMLLSLSYYVMGEPGEAVSDAISAVQKLLTATFLAAASHTFDQSIYTRGCDVGHLMSGLGRRGLTSLFVNLSVLSITICVANALTLALPWVEGSAAFKYVAERTSQEVAYVLIELQRVLVRLL